MTEALLAALCETCGLNLFSGDRDELSRLAAEHAALHENIEDAALRGEAP